MQYYMKYVDSWEETKARFTAWWQGKNIDRPLMKVVARREQPTEPLTPSWKAKTFVDKHLEVERKVVNMRNYCRTYRFFAEAFPSLDINIGAGSFAVYLGSSPSSIKIQSGFLNASMIGKFGENSVLIRTITGGSGITRPSNKQSSWLMVTFWLTSRISLRTWIFLLLCGGPKIFALI